MKYYLAALLWIVFVASTHASAAEPKPLMREFMGINGHTIQFDSALYAEVCRLARDYHPYQWDVDNVIGGPTHFPTSLTLDWKDKSGKFRDWKGPVDWQKIYGQWQKDGFEVHACLQFDGVAFNQWPDIEKNTFDYGKAFAAYCGPSHHKLVTSVEIGNEPAGNKQYSADQYKTVLRAMSRGIREGDPKLKIVSCAVQAGKGDGYCEPIDVLKGESKSYDVVNLHQYAFLAGWPSFERTYPENEKLNYLGLLQKSIDWRNENAAGKPVWLTEFGYDSSTKPPEPKNAQWKGCTDLQQAQWIVRSYLVMAELDLGRAYLYFFDDNDQPSLHASSGITRHLEPKPSYWAMRHLYHTLGDCRFSRVIEKSADVNGAYIFEFTNGKNANQLIWVAWLASGSDRTAEKKKIKLPGNLIKAERMATKKGEDTRLKMDVPPDRSVTISLSESPIFLVIKK